MLDITNINLPLFTVFKVFEVFLISKTKCSFAILFMSILRIDDNVLPVLKYRTTLDELSGVELSLWLGRFSTSVLNFWTMKPFLLKLAQKSWPESGISLSRDCFQSRLKWIWVLEFHTKDELKKRIKNYFSILQFTFNFYCCWYGESHIVYHRFRRNNKITRIEVPLSYWWV